MDEEVLEESESAAEEEAADEEALFCDQEIRECFSVFDPKRRGEMPSKFLHKALGSLGINLTSVEIEDLLEKYDSEGSIKFGDFHEYAMEKLREIEPFQHIKHAFSVFEAEVDGPIPTDRFRKWMTSLGDPLTEAEAKELCRMADPANKGAFDPRDVIAMLVY